VITGAAAQGEADADHPPSDEDGDRDQLVGEQHRGESLVGGAAREGATTLSFIRHSCFPRYEVAGLVLAKAKTNRQAKTAKKRV
jgi:hypothetical protein